MRVLGELKLGLSQAIPAHLLAKRLGAPERQVRKTIRLLIERRHLILSSVSSPPGYFIGETRKEVEDCLETLQSRLLHDARRKRDIKLAAAKVLQPEQLKMEAF